ncbi:uncharacterized protein AB9X84_006210 isoform 1-T1 [Acanthopagrus schlegelii]
MLSFMIFCPVWFLLTVLIACRENSTGTAVILFSVPEDHHVRLPCGGSGSSDVVWTHQDRTVLVTRQGSYETNEDPRRYLLLPDGSLHLLHLDDSDGGEYRCNQQLVAELQVLTGEDFGVPAGRTLLLPCRSSSKARQKWFFYRRDGGKRELIFTWFRNGTMKPERSRLSYENEALQIRDLQPEDAGEYQCNRKTSSVTVLTVQPEPTSVHQTSRTTTTPAVRTTDVVETKKKEKKKPENALLVVAVVSLALMILLMAAVCALLTSMKCRRKKNRRSAAPRRREDTELQPWTTSSGHTECELYESPSVPEETIHYASLGRQNWRERPSRTPPDQDHHRVIYSSVITRAAAK